MALHQAPCFLSITGGEPKPSALPKGLANSSEPQAFAAGPERSCCSAGEEEGSKKQSRQLAEKRVCKRQTCKHAQKPPLPASAPQHSSPWRLRALLCAPQPLLAAFSPHAALAPGLMAPGAGLAAALLSTGRVHSPGLDLLPPLSSPSLLLPGSGRPPLQTSLGFSAS